MAKSLNDVLKLYSDAIAGKRSSAVTALTTGENPGVDYADKMKDTRDFIAQHSVEKFDDRVGNGDDVYQATNVKKAKMERHGHEPKPKDIQVYKKNQQVAEAKDNREYDYEGEMAVTKLKTIIRAAEHLIKMMEPNTNLPEWVQSKIIKAEDYITTAHDYLMSEMNEETEQLDETEKDNAIRNYAMQGKDTQKTNIKKQFGEKALKKALKSRFKFQQAQKTNEETEHLDENVLGAKIKAYADHHRSAFDAYDYGNDEEGEHHEKRAEKIHADIVKNHGIEAGHHARAAGDAAIYGTERSRSIKKDTLSGGLRKYLSTNVTKAGRIPKQTQKAMKGYAASGEGPFKRDIDKPKGKLPEEVQLDEAKCNMTEAGKMCEVHGMKDCKKSSGKKLLLDKDIKEKTMTAAEKKKEESLKNKYDDSDMKEKMKKQYGDKKGEQVYFAYIRKQAMQQESISDQRSSKKTSTEEARKEMYKAFLRKKERKEKMKEATTDTTNNYTVDGSNNLGFKL